MYIYVGIFLIFRSEHQRMIREIHEVVPFIIKGRSTNVEVLDPLSSNYLDLTTISDTFEPSNPGFFSHIWGFVMGIRQRGLQNTEEMLKEGAIVTGIGEIVLEDDGMKLQPPFSGVPFFITTLPISSLVRKLQERRKFYKYFTVICGTVGLFVLGMILNKWWKDRIRKLEADERRQKLEESRKERRRQARNVGTIESHGSDTTDVPLCVVCQTNPREIIVLGCGHVCVCEDCAENIGDLCPLCRGHIEKLLPAYIP